jgi:integrase
MKKKQFAVNAVHVGPYWYARIKVDGKVVDQQRLHAAPKWPDGKEEADALCLPILKRLEAGLDVGSPAHRDLDAAWGKYLNDKCRGEDHNKESTITVKREHWSYFTRWLAEKHASVDRPDKITNPIMVSYFAFVRGKGWSPAMQSSAYTYLGAFFKWCIRMGYMTKHPMDASGPREEKIKYAGRKRKSDKVPTYAEFLRLLAHLRPDAQLMAFVGWFTHLRPQELCNLEWYDFVCTDPDLDKWVLGVGPKMIAVPVKRAVGRGRRPMAEQEVRVEKWEPKDKERREISVEAAVMGPLLAFRGRSWSNKSAEADREKQRLGKRTVKPFFFEDVQAPMFRNQDGQPMTPDSWTQLLHDACRRAGLPLYSGYDLRRGGATHYNQMVGVPIETMRVRLGHTTVEQTKQYIGVTGESQQRAIDRAYGREVEQIAGPEAALPIIYSAALAKIIGEKPGENFTSVLPSAPKHKGIQSAQALTLSGGATGKQLMIQQLRDLLVKLEQ